MAVHSNKKFSDPSFESTTLKNLQQGEDTAFVPVFTEHENYKVDVKELNSQVLKKIDDTISINNNVISAKDTKLKAGTNIDISDDNVISYTGPEGSSNELIADDRNISINTNTGKVSFNLKFGSEVRTSEAHNDTNLMINEGTSTYFTRGTDGHSLVPHFAGFTNNMIFFGNNFDPELNAKLVLVISDVVSLQYYDPQTPEEQEKHWTLQNDLTFAEDSGATIHVGIDILPFSQIIFNIPNLRGLYLHSYWLKKQSFKELLVIQVNKKSLNTDAGLKTIGMWNGSTEDNSNYYFYHNGLVYTKENVVASSLVRISDKTVGTLEPFTELTGYQIQNSRYRDYTLSYPFVSPAYNDLEINTVNRFYCMSEFKNNKRNYYIIESMY